MMYEGGGEALGRPADDVDINNRMSKGRGGVKVGVEMTTTKNPIQNAIWRWGRWTLVLFGAAGLDGGNPQNELRPSQNSTQPVRLLVCSVIPKSPLPSSGPAGSTPFGSPVGGWWWRWVVAVGGGGGGGQNGRSEEVWWCYARWHTEWA